MTHRVIRRKAVVIGIVAISLFDSGLAVAQMPPPPGSNYGAPPPPPPGATYSMPPPPGMNPQDATADMSPQARAQDDQYSYAAEQWAAQNCVAQRANDTAAGAVIGGLVGALAGAGLAGHHDRGAGIVAGGAVGAIAGGAIGGSAAASNPNCPPGYVLRGGAPPFYPGPVYGPVVYAAPGWYNPWVWYGGHWIYRPYPYHRYWYRSHRRDFH
jgi:hypothetical protein